MSASAPSDGMPRGAKSPAAFRTISEVSAELDVPQHVLRFWESKFAQIRPLKRGGGRRYYRPEDVELLRRIQHLLYNEGYTIKGVQRLLRDSRSAGAEPEPPPPDEPGLGFPEPDLTAHVDPTRHAIEAAIQELEDIRDTLRAALSDHPEPDEDPEE